MLKNTKKFFSDMFGKNPEVSKKPLTKLSILFVIVFDIFLFSNIWDGYSYQKDSITSPYDKYICDNFFTSSDYNLDEINLNINEYRHPNNKVSEYCIDFIDFYEGLDFTDYKSIVARYDVLKRNLSNYNSKKTNYEKQYGKYLDETSAGITDQNDRLSDINGGNAREEYQNILENISQIEAEIEQNKLSIQNLDVVIKYKAYVDVNYKIYNEAREKALFWYPVKVALFQAILILPLFLISLFLYKVNLRRQNRIYTILFSNLTFITGIFVFFLLFKVLYFILPKKFLANLLATLKSLNLGFLWNYILVFLGIVIFGVIIYWSQKGSEKLQLIREENEKKRVLENKQRIVKERFFAGRCVECNSKLLDNSRFCSHCGVDQYFDCKKCGEANPVSFDFCKKCGTNKHNID